MDIIDLIFDTLFQLNELGKVLLEFLTFKFEIGTVEISMWGLLGGVGIIAMIIYSVIQN